MGKLFWLDSETTGVNSQVNAIIQLSGIVEFDGQIIESFNSNIKPFPGAVIDEKALEVNKTKKEDLQSYPIHQVVYKNLITFLNKYVDKFDTKDKFILAGYNVGFDDGFLRAFFQMNNDRYYGSYFAWPKIDVAHLVAEKYADGLRLPNFQLSTLCNHFCIPIEAHDSAGDIRATRDLYYKLRG